MFHISKYLIGFKLVIGFTVKTMRNKSKRLHDKNDDNDDNAVDD